MNPPRRTIPLADLITTYNALVGFKVAHGGVAPTLDEMCELTGVSYKSVMRNRVKRLEEIGLIKTVPNEIRSVELVGEVYTPPPITQGELVKRIKGEP